MAHTITGPNPGVGPTKRFGVAVTWRGRTDIEAWFYTRRDRQEWLDANDCEVIAWLALDTPANVTGA